MSGWNQEQEYQAGVMDERERIIAIAKDVERHSTHSELCYKEHLFVERFIDAIKGENK